ncbi:MAG: hypothetical protein NDJ90_07170 [Oligoflexia bacterium]|nr:hypothetical protein [Oligoflexia bacterium]
MRLFFHRYELKPRAALNSRTGTAPRAGALLKLECEEGVGYADCHPWELFGDAPLGRQLEALSRGTPTALGVRSLELARIDARARGEGRSLFEGLAIPRSHALVTDVSTLTADELLRLREAGFDRVKLKVGRDVPAELRQLGELCQALPEGLLLRLDFNSSLKVREFEGFVEAAAPWRERVEFFEDPVAWDRGAWGWLRRERGATLALDREAGALGRIPAEAVDVVVHKPAVESRYSEGFPVVFTSNMDHPLGQAAAAYVAALELARRPGEVRRCGLLSHTVYELNAFSEALRVRGSEFLSPEGTGFGFDPLLTGLRWEPLA